MPYPELTNVLLETPTDDLVMTRILKIINVYFVLGILFTELPYFKFSANITADDRYAFEVVYDCSFTVSPRSGI